MAKVTDLNSLLHHLVDTGKIETEGEWILAHQLIDQNFPVAILDNNPISVQKTTPPVDETLTSLQETTSPITEVPFSD
jgi:hypothetical protein